MIVMFVSELLARLGKKGKRINLYNQKFLCATLNDKVDISPNDDFTTNAEVVFLTNLNESQGHVLNCRSLRTAHKASKELWSGFPLIWGRTWTARWDRYVAIPHILFLNAAPLAGLFIRRCLQMI